MMNIEQQRTRGKQNKMLAKIKNQEGRGKKRPNKNIDDHQSLVDPRFNSHIPTPVHKQFSIS